MNAIEATKAAVRWTIELASAYQPSVHNKVITEEECFGYTLVNSQNGDKFIKINGLLYYVNPDTFFILLMLKYNDRFTIDGYTFGLKLSIIPIATGVVELLGEVFNTTEPKTTVAGGHGTHFNNLTFLRETLHPVRKSRF